MTVRQLQGQVDALELMEWEAYFKLEPFGSKVNRTGHAITAQILANVNKKKSVRSYKSEDFMGEFGEVDRPVVRQTPEDQLTVVESINKALGGKDLRKRNKDG